MGIRSCSVVSLMVVDVRVEVSRISSEAVAKTEANGTATGSISPTHGPNHDQDSLTIDVKPPAGSKYRDRRGNAGVMVVKGA